MRWVLEAAGLHAAPRPYHSFQAEEEQLEDLRRRRKEEERAKRQQKKRAAAAAAAGGPVDVLQAPVVQAAAAADAADGGPKSKRARKDKGPYIPKTGSGNYAILINLYILQEGDGEQLHAGG